MITCHKVSCEPDPSPVPQTMPRKRSPAEVLCQARERASLNDKSIVNGERAARELQPEVSQRYLDILALWEEYVAS
jgi:hypothetical protein